MSKRSFRTALGIVLAILAILVAFVIWFVVQALDYGTHPHEGAGSEIAVEVKTGMGFPSVAALLADRGVIAKPGWFRMYAMWKGQTSNIKTGKYTFTDKETPEEVLAMLVAGVKEKTVRVILPEGLNMLEYFDTIAKANVVDAASLTFLARDHDYLAKHGIAGDSVEGYLFPDTYDFRVGSTARQVLDKMIAQHHAVWNALATKHARDLAKLKEKVGWSDRDVLILASIVEKEAEIPSERPRIAQVFVNRMTSPGFPSKKLETDPTIRYGCMVPVQKSIPCTHWDKSQRLLHEQIDDADNPYNTYQHKGLPPGPISNPGKGAIEAAMAPDGSDFLYFVVAEKGGKASVFAKTFEEHKRNVDRYVHGPAATP